MTSPLGGPIPRGPCPLTPLSHGLLVQSLRAPGGGALRLNYSHPAPDEIRDGIRRLGQVLRLRNAVLRPPTGLSLVTGGSAPIDRPAAPELE